MHILLTRPLEDCSEMILKLKSLGHQVSHLPLLTIEKINYEKKSSEINNAKELGNEVGQILKIKSNNSYKR